LTTTLYHILGLLQALFLFGIDKLLEMLYYLYMENNTFFAGVSHRTLEDMLDSGQAWFNSPTSKQIIAHVLRGHTESEIQEILGISDQVLDSTKSIVESGARDFQHFSQIHKEGHKELTE